MQLRVVHRTTFTYAGEAKESFNEVRLRPADTDTQRCLDFSLRIDPGTEPRDYADFHGNTVHYFEVHAPHQRLCVTAVSRIETTPLAARPAVPEVTAEELAASPEREMLAEFHTDSPYVPLEVELWREAQDALEGRRGEVWGDVRRLGEHIHRTFTYRPNSTGVSTRAPDALRLRAGVCQDYAHVLVGLCRSLRIPALYVSGYFFTPGADASHAWAEVYVPGHGWRGLDPTHGTQPDDRYIKVAVGRDYADVAPTRGHYKGTQKRSIDVAVEIVPVAS